MRTVISPAIVMIALILSAVPVRAQFSSMSHARAQDFELDRGLLAKGDASQHVSQLGTSGALQDVIIAAWARPYHVVSYSLDAGQEWTQLAVPFNSIETPQVVPAVAVAPTGRVGQPVRLLIGYGRTIFQTSDYGATWQSQDVTLLDGCNDAFGLSPSIDQFTGGYGDGQRLYFRFTCHFSVGVDCCGIRTAIFTSGDAGETWKRMGEVVELLDGVLANPENEAEVFATRAGTSGWGVDLSPDHGETWAPTGYPMGLGDLLTLDASHSGVRYAIVDESGEYVGKRSTNGGLNWQNWTDQPCDKTAVSGTDPRPVANLHLATYGVTSGVLMLRCASGLYRSVDGGDTWEQKNADGGELLVNDQGNPNRLLWVVRGELWESRDGGATWGQISVGFGGNWAYLPLVSR